jgi:glycosyltransferase involved in cell wall biosynthesis
VIHIVLRASKAATESPFAIELRRLGVPHVIFTGAVPFAYRHRIWLVFVGLPKLALRAAGWAVQSMVLARPKPDAVVVGTHFEVLAFGLLRALGFARPRIVMLGFIYTDRRQPWLNALRLRYFRLVFSFADTVICHSTVEVARYGVLFAGSRAVFVFMPYGLHIWGRPSADAAVDAEAARPAPEPRRYVLAAGRSGRDYATLVRAAAGLAVDVHIVCDNEAMVGGLPPAPNVQVLRHCYAGDYVQQLRDCALVAIPLGVADISAGQMVLIQAMAFAKPTVITATPTVREYTTNGLESIHVAQGDAKGLRAAIERVLDDPALAARLGRAAEAAYEERYSMRAYVRELVACVGG